MRSHVVYQVWVGQLRLTKLIFGYLCRLPMPKDRIFEVCRHLFRKMSQLALVWFWFVMPPHS